MAETEIFKLSISLDERYKWAPNMAQVFGVDGTRIGVGEWTLTLTRNDDGIKPYSVNVPRSGTDHNARENSGA